MNRLSEDQLGKISRIVREVEKLSDIEKLFLYLQLPCGRAEVPEGEQNAPSGDTIAYGLDCSTPNCAIIAIY